MAIPAAIIAAGAAIGITNTATNIVPPFQRWLTYRTNQIAPNAVPDLPYLLDLYRKSLYIADETISELGDLGFSRDKAVRFLEAAKARPSVYEYIDLVRRKLITPEVFYKETSLLGFQSDEIDLILTATEYFPQVGDLIKFMIRDVYEPEVVQKFQLMKDIPAQFTEDAKKVGINENWSDKFWAAHWMLPSIGQGFEMFQRTLDTPIDPDADKIPIGDGKFVYNILGKSSLETLMKTADYMPWYWDKLKEIAYRPYNRVDVRRMYRVGTLEKSDVYRSYLDLGYDPKKAERMTDFTIRYETNELDGISRSNVLKAYKQGIINEDELTQFLLDFGYSNDVVNFWLDSAQYDKTLELVKDYTDELIDEYRLGMIDISDVRVKLVAANLPQNYIDKIMHTVIERKAEKAKMPSKEDVDRWIDKDIITEDVYVNYLRRMGYLENDIINYLTEYAITKSRTKRKYLDQKIYFRWYQSDIISLSQLEDILKGMSINEADVIRLLNEQEKTKDESKR